MVLAIDGPMRVATGTLCDEVKHAARCVLLGRIGPTSRRVLACRGQGALSDGMRRLVDVARKPVTIARLVSTVGDGDVAALERIARLLQRQWLVAGTVSERHNVSRPD